MYWYNFYRHLGNEVICNSVATSDLIIGQKRLLTTNNILVVPINKSLRFLITSNDVLHS